MSSSVEGGERLRDLFQDLPKEIAANEECPSADRLWASAQRTLDREENRRVVDHMGRCTSCAAEWRVARSMAARARDGRIEAHETSRWQAPSMAWLAAAAVVVLCAGLGVLLVQEDERQRVYRQGPFEVIVSLVPEDQPLTRSDPTLRWSGPEGASYSLTVTSERLELLAQADRLDDAQYTLAQTLVAERASGTILLWHVEAILPDGSRLPSQTFRVRLE